MATVTLRRGEVQFTQDLSGATTTTTFPSSSSGGVPKVAGYGGERIHVATSYEAASGVLSTDIHLYGYSAQTGRWHWIQQMYGGSLTARQDKWSAGNTVSAYAVAVADFSADNYDRYATRCISPGGTSPVVSTWIGFETP